MAEIEPFLQSDVAKKLLDRGWLIPTRRLDGAEVEMLRHEAGFSEITLGYSVATVFEHERVEFPSYPYEWAPEMLYAAGMLTLDIAQAALEAGYSLKDATPYNVLFRGPVPVFIDLLSFEPRKPGDPIWKPSAQFFRTFVLPLLAHKYWGVRPADIFTNHRDGLEPADVYRWVGPVRRFLPPFLSAVSLPTWLGRRAADRSIYRERLLSNREKARFILDSLFNRLRRALRSVEPRPKKDSVWSGYMESHSYTERNFKAKEAFVQAVLDEFQPKRVLDVGANTGHFSLLAARRGARVVAIDYDIGCIGTLWQQAGVSGAEVLPLVVDLSRPSAAEGWRNRECVSFLERAVGAFDAVLMLAVLHHLLVTERVPLTEILGVAAELTRDLLIIEFVGPEDEMFQTIARGRENLHAGLNEAVFEAACKRHFRILRSERFPDSHRRLYLLKKTTGAQ